MKITTVCRGAVPEVFDHSISEVLKNICDPSTDPEQKRTITLQFDVAPFKDRSGAQITFSVKIKNASIEPIVGQAFFSKQSGVLRAYSSDPRQDELFAASEVIPGKQ